MKRLLAALLLLFTTQAFADWGGGLSGDYNHYLLSEMTPGPNVHWAMSESSGPTIANSGSSGSPYNLTAVNSPTFGSPGANPAHKTSIIFNGTTQYANVNRNDTGTGPGDLGGDRTFACWVNRPVSGGGTTGASMAVLKALTGADTDKIWFLAWNNSDVVVFVVYNTAGAVYQIATGATVLTRGTWHFIAATWQSATPTSTVYLDGVNDGSDSATNGTRNSSQQWFEVARLEQASTIYLGGSLQDCSIWGLNALSPTTIATLFNKGVGGNVLPWRVEFHVPRYSNPGYLEKVVNRGYLTGLFRGEVIPQRVFLGFVPFGMEVPRGDLR